MARSNPGSKSPLLPARNHLHAEAREIPTDPMTLMSFGIGAVIVVWLIFSILKKMVGIAIVLALAAGGWFLWTNPQHLGPIIAWVRQFTG